MIDELVRRIVASIEPVTRDFEIILVDDRAPGDNSWGRIAANAAADPRVRGVRLSRNFGQHRAITAGLAQARGEWVVVMDCDLQDQPEEIPSLLAHARQGGYDMVFARRVERQDTWLKRLSSKLFYGTLGWLTETPQDPAIANFGVYHQKVIRAVLAMGDSIRYFPTMVRWVGFHPGALPVAHAERAEGGSTYNLRRLLQLALDIILSYSDKPLRITIKLGLLISAVALLMALVTVVRFLSGQIVVLGYTSLILSVWLFSGLLVATLGMVGLYVGKTFEQAKNRPVYLLDVLTDGPTPDPRTGSIQPPQS